MQDQNEFDLIAIIKELWEEIKNKTAEIQRRDKVLIGLALYAVYGEVPAWLL